MAKQEIEYAILFRETLRKLTNPGLLLQSLDEAGKANPMTIGWGTPGVIWGRPMFLVLVRPSRYTYACIEHTGDFTVNVPPAAMDDFVAFCGSASGRDHDKLAEKGMTASPSLKVESPIIEECVIHYECRVVHKNDVIPAELKGNITDTFYSSGDFHRVYFGEILATRADEGTWSSL